MASLRESKSEMEREGVGLFRKVGVFFTISYYFVFFFLYCIEYTSTSRAASARHLKSPDDFHLYANSAISLSLTILCLWSFVCNKIDYLSLLFEDIPSKELNNHSYDFNLRWQQLKKGFER